MLLWRLPKHNSVGYRLYRQRYSSELIFWFSFCMWRRCSIIANRKCILFMQLSSTCLKSSRRHRVQQITVTVIVVGSLPNADTSRIPRVASIVSARAASQGMTFATHHTDICNKSIFLKSGPFVSRLFVTSLWELLHVPFHLGEETAKTIRQPWWRCNSRELITETLQRSANGKVSVRVWANRTEWPLGRASLMSKRKRDNSYIVC